MLPVAQAKDQILDALRSTDRLILHALTGSGKSTQLPQILVDGNIVDDEKEVVVLQPRRLAARMLASRVASERGGRLGEEVGYHIRFDRAFSSKTRIKFLTEGILLRQMLGDRSLNGVGAVIFDEFHERNLYTDLSLSIACQIQETLRKDLKIIVMSATLDTEMLEKWLNPCKLLKVDGRFFPVDIEYSAAPTQVADKPVWEQAAWHFKRIATSQAEGDFLIFMPGAFEIRKTMDAIRSLPVARDFDVLPLHGELPAKDQDMAVGSTGRRKVVVSTNVAETSLTIEGTRVVIDSGLAKIARHDPRRGINTLLVEKISQASADQRSGRAGRTAPGYCLRMWGANEHKNRPKHDEPEVRRVDLSETLLSLKADYSEDMESFNWFEKPDDQAMEAALGLLNNLGALDNNGKITDVGEKMSAFPLHPRYARMLLAAQVHNCVYAMCLMAAFTQGRNLLLHLKDKKKNEAREDMLGGDVSSDFFHLFRAWTIAKNKNYDTGFCREWGIHAQSCRQAERTAEQFVRLADQQGLNTESLSFTEAAVQKCLLLGFSDQLAVRSSRGTLRVRMVGGRNGELRRQSAVGDAPLIVAAETEEVMVRGSVTVMLGLATAIDESWLKEIFPDDFCDSSEVVFDTSLRRVIKRTFRRFRDLVIESRDDDSVPESDAAAILAEAVLEENLVMKQWGSDVERYISRINFAARHCPEYEFQAIGADDRKLILEQICLGAVSYKEIKNREVMPSVKEWLTEEQKLALDNLVPESISLPGRKKPANIRYEEDGKAVLSSKLQDFYNVKGDSLRIAGGKVGLTLELLAPNQRPVQITDDIDGFWDGAYPQIKKDLKGRYPKHEWR